MDKLGLLADSQHGFRKRRSTETQLIPFIDDLAKSLDVGEQIDCILLDFSKAFDKVPHSRLLMKLQHYGVRGHLHDWITSFLLGRTQCVALDSQSSAATTVSSGVPQGTVLGSLLFLLFINDLPSVVSSTTRLYLGLNIHKSLSWDSHIDKITKKVNSTLAFLGRNVSRCPTTIKAQCYTTLVRPTLEYASSIWSPIKKDSINKVEAVQRRAARFATGDYQRTSSVTAMLQQLHWQTLQSRREYAQTVMMHRIVYNLVDIPYTI
jgi:hypothetical protein